MSDYPKTPPVGSSVVWYPHGDTNQEPFAATVVSRLNDDCITLYTLSPTGRREPMLNVKHVSNPDHDHSPQGLKRWGAWDVVGAHEERKIKSEERLKERREKSQKMAVAGAIIGASPDDDPDEIEQMVIDMAKEMGEIPGRAQLIAQKVKGGMNHQRVNAILRKYAKLLTEAAALTEG